MAKCIEAKIEQLRGLEQYYGAVLSGDLLCDDDWHTAKIYLPGIRRALGILDSCEPREKNNE